MRTHCTAFTSLVPACSVPVSGAARDGCAGADPARSQAIAVHFALGSLDASLRGSTGSPAPLTQANADALAPPAAVRGDA